MRFSLKAFILTLTFLLASRSYSEQSASGKINKIEVVNYNDGAAYVYIEGALFNECPNSTNWCAIDFSLPSGNQMYSAVLAAKMADKKIGITTNSCWSGGQYARCWKVHISE